MDKLQRAGRDFLLRFIAKHGLRGAARILRRLADEIEDLATRLDPLGRIGEAAPKLNQVGACVPRRVTKLRPPFSNN